MAKLGKTDTVFAMLAPNEAVVNAEGVDEIGKDGKTGRAAIASANARGIMKREAIKQESGVKRGGIFNMRGYENGSVAVDRSLDAHTPMKSVGQFHMPTYSGGMGNTKDGLKPKEDLAAIGGYENGGIVESYGNPLDVQDGMPKIPQPVKPMVNTDIAGLNSGVNPLTGTTLVGGGDNAQSKSNLISSGTENGGGVMNPYKFEDTPQGRPYIADDSPQGVPTMFGDTPQGRQYVPDESPQGAPSRGEDTAQGRQYVPDETPQGVDWADMPGFEDGTEKVADAVIGDSPTLKQRALTPEPDVAARTATETANLRSKMASTPAPSQNLSQRALNPNPELVTQANTKLGGFKERLAASEAAKTPSFQNLSQRALNPDAESVSRVAAETAGTRARMDVNKLRSAPAAEGGVFQKAVKPNTGFTRAAAEGYGTGSLPPEYWQSLGEKAGNFAKRGAAGLAEGAVLAAGQATAQKINDLNMEKNAREGSPIALGSGILKNYVLNPGNVVEDIGRAAGVSTPSYEGSPAQKFFNRDSAAEQSATPAAKVASQPVANTGAVTKEATPPVTTGASGSAQGEAEAAQPAAKETVQEPQATGIRKGAPQLNILGQPVQTLKDGYYREGGVDVMPWSPTDDSALKHTMTAQQYMDYKTGKDSEGMDLKRQEAQNSKEANELDRQYRQDTLAQKRAEANANRYKAVPSAEIGAPPSIVAVQGPEAEANYKAQQLKSQQIQNAIMALNDANVPEGRSKEIREWLKSNNVQGYAQDD